MNPFLQRDRAATSESVASALLGAEMPFEGDMRPIASLVGLPQWTVHDPVLATYWLRPSVAY